MATASFSRIPFSTLVTLTTRFDRIGAFLLRYGLVLTLGWIGAVKFLPYEAEGIVALIKNSPLMSWMYSVWSVQGTSNVIGATELVIALLIAARPILPLWSALGSALAAFTFLLTISFLFTTPGMWDAKYGFPAISAGGFLLKDVILLGAALWTCADALRAAAPGAGSAD
jgi:reactive chlorine resistance protein C